MMDGEEVREIKQLREVMVEIETERGWQTIGSGENRGLLIAMDIVQAKLNTLTKELFLKCEIEEKDTIKIRYSYITSLTNVKEDPFYKENLTFRILTLNDLEASHGALKDLLTLEGTALIRILGRDICTGRTDKNGKPIYEGDIIRWYTHDRRHVAEDETVISSTAFYEQEPEMDCVVVGTIYDKGDI